MKDSLLGRAWRRRLAVMLRRFRRERGRWPSRDIVEAAKRGIAAATSGGILPPVEH